MSDLYKHPEQYDREHLGDEEDIGFYLSLSRRPAPRKVLELGCGTGRITLPLAQLGFEVVGLDNQPEMLQKAEERRLRTSSETRKRLQFIEGDMRTWSAQSDFDLILIPASSISHVLSLEDQLAVWKTCHDNLRPDGRLLVEITMPNMASFADSFSVCASSKPNPHDFIGGLERLAIACVDGRAAKCNDPGRPKRTSDPHRADFAVALVARLARKPGDRSARYGVALAP
jgi:SAM-dependent methyltransferase